MAAMEGHGNRSPVQKLLEADHLPGLVGQDERGHRLADLRRRLAGAILTKPLDEPIHRGGKFRPFSSYRLSKSAKLLLQRHVEIAHAPECIVQGLLPIFAIMARLRREHLALAKLQRFSIAIFQDG